MSITRFGRVGEPEEQFLCEEQQERIHFTVCNKPSSDAVCPHMDPGSMPGKVWGWHKFYMVSTSITELA